MRRPRQPEPDPHGSCCRCFDLKGLSCDTEQHAQVMHMHYDEDDITGAEMQQRMEDWSSSLRTRRKELEKAGFIRYAGYRRHGARVYEPTELGREAVERHVFAKLEAVKRQRRMLRR